jgi:cell division protein FtsI (penicillin-binding protein 3)
MVKKDYKPRVFVVLLVFLGFYLIILTRLYLIQVHRKDFFKDLAEQQYGVELTISPHRAKIYDTYGVPLVINRDAVSAFILPKQFNDKKKTEKFLKVHFEKIYQKIQKNKNKKFAWLERKITPQRLEELKKIGTDDIYYINEPQRFYPYQSLSTILGFTDIDNIGLGGIELAFNKSLAGSSTVIDIKKDARSAHFYFDKEVVKQGTKGSAVHLTIDSKLQFLAYEELKQNIANFGAEGGSVLVLNPDNGNILAMANYPDFDSNQREIKDLDVTKNKIITECFEFGSVLKAFAALAALEEKVVTIDELIDCEGKIAYFGKFKVENWTNTGMVPFSDVIRMSSNIGIAKVAQRLDNKLYDHLRRVGFGKRTGIEFPGERDGFVNPPANWSKSSCIVMSFGYEVSATLLQLAKAFCIIANGGYDVTTRLIKNENEPSLNSRKKLYSDETIKQMKDILEGVGKSYNKGLESFRVMGKTGTARKIVDGKYSIRDHIYSFVGIVEKDDYRRVIVTFINNPNKGGLWASQVSAPFCNRVAERMVVNDLLRKTRNA